MTAGLSSLITWLQFLLCAGVIMFAGTRLTKYGDIIPLAPYVMPL